MIRLAREEDLAKLHPDSEAAVKVLGLYKAYGLSAAFVRYWVEERDGTLLSLIAYMDGVATVALCSPICTPNCSEELSAFIQMQPDFAFVRTTAEAAKAVAQNGGWQLSTGTVMKAELLQFPSLTPTAFTPKEAYSVLGEVFGESMVEYSSFYVDMSHRLRHGCGRMVGFFEGGQPVACAMTTAECDRAALIGAVATLPLGRGKGYASSNVLTLAHQLKDEAKTVFLSPKNEAAETLYRHIGFVPCGEWGILQRKTS